MKIVILGAGQVGSTVAHSLSSEENDITVVDINAAQLKELQDRLDIRGVIGHAWSPDLVSWEVRAPLSEPGEFGHLEVPQVEIVRADRQALVVEEALGQRGQGTGVDDGRHAIGAEQCGDEPVVRLGRW